MKYIKIKFIAFLASILVIVLVITSFQKKENGMKETASVQGVLAQLGDQMPLHYIPENELDSAKIAQGKNLVQSGFTHTTSKSLFESRQSKHFVCTDCHNFEREDPDLSKSNPETRLSYVVENKLNFLPATTLYGTVNKNHWYNDDYLKKYGDLVVPARDSLHNAVQLCAVVCSQGRALTDEEMEGVMHYLNSIGYTIKDLGLTNSELELISKILESGENNSSKKEAIALIKAKYLDYSPATFMDPQTIESRKQGSFGNPRNGKIIYDLSCLTCHKEGGVTNYKLNDEQLTFKHLSYWAKTDKVFSVYNITRKGTYSKNGYKPYMPNYTKQRLSDQQLEDLMAYINGMARHGKIQTISGTPSF